MGISDRFFVFILCFFVGIIGAYFFIEKEFLKLTVFFLCTLYFYFRYLKKQGFSKIVFLFIFGVVFGVLRLLLTVSTPENNVGFFTGNNEFLGCVSQEPDVRTDKVKYVFSVKKIKIDGVYKNISGKILLVTPRYPLYEYGDCLNVAGNISLAGDIGDFDYGSYLKRYGISAVSYTSRIRLRNEKDENYFFKNIFAFKSFFENQLFTVFLEPHASFIDGLLLGSRRGIDSELMDKFNITGLSHIIAISGYNITLLIIIIGSLLGFLSQKTRIIFSIILIVLFVILVGASSAVVRAGIMGIISLFALWFNRKYYVVLALFVSAFFMNLINPFIIIFDVGFQLSFLATFGLVFFSDSLKNFFYFIPDFWGIREALLLTISAQIFALPVILNNFGGISLISPVANLFVLPFIPFIMLFSFIAVVLSFIFRPFAIIFEVITELMLDAVIFFVKFFAEIDFAYLKMDFFDFRFVIICFFILVDFFVLEKIRKPSLP